MTSLCVLICCAVSASANVTVIQPDKANVISFPATEVRFVRMVINESSGGQPCIDELEVYGNAKDQNLALAENGAKAATSSCLAGYAIHQTAHLNDGKYGNNHSWIAASTNDEWAQIELPKPVAVSKIVFSRDRQGRFRDRVPLGFEIQISVDGKKWKTVRTVNGTTDPSGRPLDRIARTATRWSDFVIPSPATVGPLDTSDAAIAAVLKRGDTIRYAFLCEARTCAKVDKTDPIGRIFKQYTEMLERLGRQGLDVSKETKLLSKLSARHKLLAVSGDAKGKALRKLFFEARLAKRDLFFARLIWLRSPRFFS